jgi:hypothetical protein
MVKGLLLDYGGTLVEEVSVDLRAGNEWMRRRHRIDRKVSRWSRSSNARSGITKEVAARRDEVYLETRGRRSPG